MDAIETWTTIPGHEDYEASTDGLVRSWKRKGGPRIIGGRMWRGTTYYTLDGVDEALADIIGRTFGPDAQDEALEEMSARERELDAYAIREIRSYEGIKDSRDVALDFRIYPARVRLIWDGIE